MKEGVSKKMTHPLFLLQSGLFFVFKFLVVIAVVVMARKKYF